MSQNERIYRIHQLLQDRGVVPTTVFLDELEVSPATFKRDLQRLRDRFNAPIEADREAGGYRYTRDHLHVGPRFELPGIWFNAAEVYSLLTMQELLKQLEPGLLGARIAPLLTRLRAMLDSKDAPAQDIAGRIRILRSAGRLHEPAHFGQVAIGTLQRRQLQISYFVRERNERT